MNKRKLTFILLGILFVVWFLITLYVFIFDWAVGMGLPSQELIEQYQFGQNVRFATVLVILILVGFLWGISYRYLKNQKNS